MKLKKKIKIVISVDGGAGSGKTTGSRLIAKKFGLELLSSGLLYRYCAYKLLKKNKVRNKKIFLKKIVKRITNKKLKNKNLYNPDVTVYASTIAKIKFVRDLLRSFQKNFARSGKCILEIAVFKSIRPCLCKTAFGIYSIICPKPTSRLALTTLLNVRTGNLSVAGYIGTILPACIRCSCPDNISYAGDSKM